MNMIDIDRFICSLIERFCDVHNIDRSVCKCLLDDVLADQGIIYKDGKLQRITLKIEYGKWYLCIKDLYFPIGQSNFTKGKLYKSERDYELLDDNGKIGIFLKEFNTSEYFRPATEEEIKGNFGGISSDSQRLVAAEAKEEIYPEPEFTEFEEKLKELFDITDFGARDTGKTLMEIARKQIVEEFDEDTINEMVEDRAEHCGNPCTLYYEGSVKNYRKGILDTLEKIKKGE